ncbi:hypothetical protein U9M48_012444 [Paspalum notatum var. saurae]|uniref:Integrase catalytic domain-containing protein n=1 Tax=Paspalum notatum var. saurae TaxID=547442 RepID=A0AAQ3SYA6_PASNO
MASTSGDKTKNGGDDNKKDDDINSDPSTPRTLFGGDKPREVVVERVVKEIGASVVYPELTRSNYTEWALVMQVNLEAQGLWDAIDQGSADRREDQLALAALLRAVPSELRSVLAVKKSAKEAWVVIKTMRQGVERVKAANAQKLLRQFENIRFKEGEAVDDFAMRISSLATNIRSLGEPLEEVRVVKKMLHVVPAAYKQIVLSIETLLDLNTLSLEELFGRLRATEEQLEDDGPIVDKAGRLMLAKEDWLAKHRHRLLPDSSTSGEKQAGQHSGTKAKGGCAGRRQEKGEGKECKKPKKERQEEAHLAKADVDQPALLMATAVEEAVTAPHVIHLNEKEVFPVVCEDESLWYLDTGASNHMTGQRSALAHLDDTVRGTVRFGDGSVVEIQGLGSLVTEGRTHEHKVLTDFYYIPKLKSNIISLGQLEEGGCKVVLENGVLTVLDRERALLIRAPRTNNRTYTIRLKVTVRALRELGTKNMVEGVPVINRVEQVCDGCVIGKQHRAPFPWATSFRAERGLELVHADLCGQINPPTPGGKRYFLLVVDDFSRYMWIELLSTKDQALYYLKKIKAVAESELGSKLKALRTDRGGEFNSNLFTIFYDEAGIRHYTTTPYSPQQNGVVERRNQTVVEMARCMMKSKGVPAMFWGEVVVTAVYVLNRAPTKSLNGKTPYEAWYSKKPQVQHLRTFGCLVYVKQVGPGVTKLSDRSRKMIFLGYEQGTKGYRVYDPALKQLHVSRDVVFEESQGWEWNTNLAESDNLKTFTIELTATVAHPRTGQTGEVQSAGSEQPAPVEVSPAAMDVGSPTTPSSIAATPSLTPDSQWATPPEGEEVDSEGLGLKYKHLPDVYARSDEIQNLEYSGLCLLAADEPRSVEQALQEKCWKQAMEAELEAIHENNTWVWSELPKGSRAIGLKWVFKVKKDPAGNVVKHKARLVAKGYAQRQGVDYEEVFAPVARMETVRVLLAMAANGGWQVHHMDVKSAFLNGELSEQVFVHQPPGFSDHKHEGQVLKLKKALYGLKQAPRAWNSKLDQELQRLGFSKCILEHAVYKSKSGDSFLLVGVYVDDLIICGPDNTEIVKFKQQMKGCFQMSDLGLLSYYLGIEVKQEDGEITLNQSAYTAKILELTGMSGCNHMDTPMEDRPKLNKPDSGDTIDSTNFRSVIGSLRYLVNSRPDIAYSVGVVSRYMEDPKEEHWTAVKRILRYLAGTTHYGCKYTRGSNLNQLLTGYSDSDHAGDKKDRKSTTGVVFFLGPNLITWTSQKQKVVALSSCEAEYIASAAAACQGVWLSRLIAELTGTEVYKFRLFVDNQSAIELSKNPVHHERSKHIDTRYHYIRECIDTGKIDIKHVGTQGQLADILTKPLGRVKFVEMRQKMNIVPVQQD